MDKEIFVRELEMRGEMLYRIAYSVLRSEEDCRDALQDAALKAWEKKNTLREERYFQTWLIRILINACRDIQRKRKRTVLLDEMPESAVPPKDIALSVALQQLPEKLRLPLVLAYSEGMTYREIAKALRIPETTVRGRINRGKKQLRKELEEA